MMNVIILGNCVKYRYVDCDFVFDQQRIELNESQLQDENYLQGLCEEFINNALKQKATKIPLVTVFIYEDIELKFRGVCLDDRSQLNNKLKFGYKLNRITNQYRKVGLERQRD